MISFNNAKLRLCDMLHLLLHSTCLVLHSATEVILFADDLAIDQSDEFQAQQLCYKLG